MEWTDLGDALEVWLTGLQDKEGRGTSSLVSCQFLAHILNSLLFFLLLDLYIWFPSSFSPLSHSLCVLLSSRTASSFFECRVKGQFLRDTFLTLKLGKVLMLLPPKTRAYFAVIVDSIISL